MVSAKTETATPVLKRLMAAADIPSFRALGRQAAVSQWAIQQLRRDRIHQMRLQTLERLATALNLSLADFLRHFGVLAAEVEQTTSDRDRQAALEAEYQRLQGQLHDQAEQLRQQFQREVLTTLESWLVQWPTVVHAVETNPHLPAARVVPLVQPVQQLLAQWGITAIAPIGAEVPYDPHQHELMQGTAQPGDPVKIRYTGFIQGKTLLHRARVSPLDGYA